MLHASDKTIATKKQVPWRGKEICKDAAKVELLKIDLPQPFQTSLSRAPGESHSVSSSETTGAEAKASP